MQVVSLLVPPGAVIHHHGHGVHELVDCIIKSLLAGTRLIHTERETEAEHSGSVCLSDHSPRHNTLGLTNAEHGGRHGLSCGLYVHRHKR